MHDHPTRASDGAGCGAGLGKPHPIDHQIKSHIAIQRCGIYHGKVSVLQKIGPPNFIGLGHCNFGGSGCTQRQGRTDTNGPTTDHQTLRVGKRAIQRLLRQTHRMPATGNRFGKTGFL